MSIAELRNLSRDENMKIIKALWSDLAADEEKFESPAWHAEELRKTESDLAAGSIKSLDWEKAKKSHGSSLRENPRIQCFFGLVCSPSTNSIGERWERLLKRILRHGMSWFGNEPPLPPRLKTAN